MKVVVAVYDSAIQGYGMPIVAPARGSAVRSFMDEVNRADANNPLYGHPEDFELRLLSFFDESTGVFHAVEGGIEILARGKDVKRPE